MDMSTSSAVLGMPFYASSLGASSFTIGITASLSTLLFVIFTRVFGRLSDRVNRKRVPQIACLCFALLYFFMPLCKNVKQIMLLFPMTGLMLAGFWPPFEAWIGEINNGHSLVKRVKFFNLSWTLGVMIGYAASGYIYELHYSIPFYFSCAGSLCSFITLTFQKTPNKSKKTESSETAKVNYLTRKFLLISWIANFFSWLTLGVLRFIFPKMISELGMSSSLYGRLMLAWAGIQGIVFYILGSTEKWHYRFNMIIGFQVLGCLGFLIIWRTISPLYWIFALMLFGLCTGVTYFSSIYYSLYGHTDLGNKSGWHESILSSGGFIGPFIGGALANYIDIKSPYIFCVAMIMIGIIIESLIMKNYLKYHVENNKETLEWLK